MRALALHSHILLAALAVSSAVPAFAAPPASREAQAASLIAQFCAPLVSEDSTGAEQVRARSPGLVISAPIAVRDHADAGKRQALGQFLGIAPEEMVQYAAFADTPGERSNPHAVFDPDESACLVVTVPEAGALDTAVDAQLLVEGSPWKRESSPAGDPVTWRRTTQLGESVFIMLSSLHGSSIALTTIEQRPVATAEQIASTTRAALEPCIAGVLERRAPQITVFASHFTEVDRRLKDDVTFVSLRSHVAGPRSFLQFNYANLAVFCRFMTADVRQPVADVRKAVMDVISGFPDVREVQVPARRDEPAYTAWRIQRRGRRPAAELVVEVNDKDIVVVTVEQAR
jgi:hypothetical protein